MQIIKEELRAQILRAAELEFSQKGYAAASLRTIAANAGTSTSNLYKYYNGKEDLFLAVVLPSTDECIGMIDRTFDLSVVTFASMAHHITQYTYRHKSVFMALALGPVEHYSAFLKRFSQCISRKLEQYAKQQVPEALEHIANPIFFDAVAAAYVGAVSPVMEQFADETSAELYLRELLDFMFGDLENRLRSLLP